jgi:hypothetical protein
MGLDYKELSYWAMGKEEHVDIEYGTRHRCRWLVFYSDSSSVMLDIYHMVSPFAHSDSGQCFSAVSCSHFPADGSCEAVSFAWV